MQTTRRRSGAGLILGCAALAGCRAAPPAISGGAASVRTAFTQALAPMNGAQLKTTLLEVTYGPSVASHPHSHPCAVIGYVLEGAIRTQVRGEPEHVYRAGQSFYEPPNGVHQVSANASDKETARLLAIFTCDHDAPLSSPVPEPDSGRSGQP